MSYSSSGPKPFERASKSSHHHIIRDGAVKAVLNSLYVPSADPGQSIANAAISYVPQVTEIEHVVAIDGGYTEVPIREGYPFAALHFFQFGALHFQIEDLLALAERQHILPEDMQRLKNIDRLKLAIATRGARRKDCGSLAESIRRTLQEFLRKESLGEDTSLLETLAWLVFRRYKASRASADQQWHIASSPFGTGGIDLVETEMSTAYSFKGSAAGQEILLIDVFRLHERIEEEGGAAGITAYIAGAVEHLVLLHVIRNLLRKNAAALQKVLFIMDRPTGWFGVTAPIHRLMLELDCWLFDQHQLFLAGLEKSGAFVEHAAAIQTLMPEGSFLILGDQYIYKYISPGQEDPTRPYADTSYYGHKVIFRSRSGQMYVVSVPVRALKKQPALDDLPNLQAILTHVEQLHCDMFDNALLPVALANKLVSLSAHPSSQILKAFAKANVG